MLEIRLAGLKYSGMVALIDDDDYALVSGYRWYAVKTNRYAHTLYAVSYHPTIYMHKLITGWPMTDHEDGDGLNNQKYNLRKTNGLLNQANSRSHVGSSRYKGVARKRDKWRAYIMAPGKKYISLGSFDIEEDAARAYDTAARERFGEHAFLNLTQ